MEISVNALVILNCFDLMFEPYVTEDEEGNFTLTFNDEDELEMFEISVYKIIETLSKTIENFDGGNFIFSNSRTYAHLFLFLRDEEGTAVYDKNFSICY